MNTDKLSGIVVYTIHDNDDLRDEFRTALISIGAEFLDESTYGLPIQGMPREDTINRLKAICKTAEEKSKAIFSKNDFVALYWPTYYWESGDDRYIKQTIII